jgi:hypothetical protein
MPDNAAGPIDLVRAIVMNLNFIADSAAMLVGGRAAEIDAAVDATRNPEFQSEYEIRVRVFEDQIAVSFRCLYDVAGYMPVRFTVKYETVQIRTVEYDDGFFGRLRQGNSPGQ